MFRGMKRSVRALSEAFSQFPEMVRVSSALENGRRPSDEDMKALGIPRNFKF